MVDPNTGFEFNLQALASETGYKTSANGKNFLVRRLAEIALPGGDDVQQLSGCDAANNRLQIGCLAQRVYYLKTRQSSKYLPFTNILKFSLKKTLTIN